MNQHYRPVFSSPNSNCSTSHFTHIGSMLEIECNEKEIHSLLENLKGHNEQGTDDTLPAILKNFPHILFGFSHIFSRNVALYVTPDGKRHC